MIDLDSIPLVPAARGNHGGTRQAGDIRYLIYHYTGNDGDTGANNAAYFRDNVVEASAHYFVDDDSVTQSVPDLTIAYAVGGKKWADCPQTGGGTMYGVIKNRNSISIEMCDTKRDGALMATEATLARAAELGKALMAKYHIPVERVYRHFDVTGKHCPAYFMNAGKWAEFQARLKEDDMTVYKTIDEVPESYRPSVQALVDKGALQGYGAGTLNISEDLCRMATVLDRLGLI